MAMQNPFLHVMRDVSAEEAPYLHQAIEELCSKAGIEKPALRFITNADRLGPLHQFTFEHMAAAMHIDTPAIILGDKMRAMLGHHTPDAVVSEEFKAVLAHEIGHLKHGDVQMHKILPLRFSPILGMVAGAAGMWYYQHLQHKKDLAQKAGVPEAQAHATIAQEWEKSDQSSVPVPPTFSHHISAAKTIAGGLLGFAVGTAVFALGHRHIEFRADRISAELMGDGKPLARALERITEGFRQTHANLPPEVAEAANKRNPVIKFFMSLMHPKTEERIARSLAWTGGR
jgi:Zn-dependent protease with chaperone function